MRDFIHAADVGTAFVAAAEHEGKNRVFNIGDGQGHSVNDIIATLERLLGRAIERRVFAPRPFDPPVNVLDIRRAQTELHWQPAVAFDDGVASALQWLRSVP